MTKNNSKRVFLDTVALSLLDNPMDVLDTLIEDGYQLVIPNTILDVEAFQEDIDTVEGWLLYEDMVIQIFMTPDKMVSKPFFWSSCKQETAAANSFEDAIAELPNMVEILAIKELMDVYGIPKGNWEMGQWAPPEPLSDEAQQMLGLTEAATRTEVLDACKAAGCMELFNKYNVGYNRGLANQHMCQYILDADGSLSEV